MAMTSETAPVTATRAKGLMRYEPSLVDEIVAFQQATYPHRRTDWIEPRWRWMYLASAQRLGVEPQVWVYHDGQQVIAHQGGIPVRLKAENHLVTTGWFVETMAREPARGRTVGPAVIMKAAEDLPFNISLGQTPAMRELQYRLGWQKVADLRTAQLLIHPTAVFADKLRIPLAARAAGAALRIRSAFRHIGRNPLIGFEVVEIERFGAMHDGLWEQVARDVTCAVVRDASYLNWKYVEQPGQSFHRLELRRAGAPAAIVVLFFAEPDALYHYRRAFLVELVAPLGDEKTLRAALEAARRFATRSGADALVCHHIGHRLTIALRQSGYLMRPSTRYLLVRPGSAEASLRDAVLEEDHWFVTMGDSDIDRPW